MIVFVAQLQCLECSECGEQVEVKRKVLRDPEQMLNLSDGVREEHKPCEEFKGNPERAALERKFRAAMRAEMRDAA